MTITNENDCQVKLDYTIALYFNIIYIRCKYKYIIIIFYTIFEETTNVIIERSLSTNKKDNNEICQLVYTYDVDNDMSGSEKKIPDNGSFGGVRILNARRKGTTRVNEQQN